jgi:hypothetical protein
VIEVRKHRGNTAGVGAMADCLPYYTELFGQIKAAAANRSVSVAAVSAASG